MSSLFFDFHHVSARHPNAVDALRQLQHGTAARVIFLLDAGGGPTHGSELRRLIETSVKPVIAAVDGAAEGEGCLMVAACAFALASETASFALPICLPDRERAIDLVSLLSGRAQKTKAPLQRLLAGEIIMAREALEIGLVTEVVAGREALFSTCRELARRMSGHAPLAMNFALEAVSYGQRVSLDEALRRETELFSRCFATTDAREGVRAFYEKRAPHFTGE